MSNNYLISGNTVTIAAEGALKVSDKLPKGIYTVTKPGPMSPYTLEQSGIKDKPEKVYGNINFYKERIVHTFQDRKDSTGVLLAGPKGTGKTLLTRCVAQELLNQGLPVVIVPFNFVCQPTIDFISTIDTECAVIFDEIDKVGRDNSGGEDGAYTDCLLSLLDGVSTFKRLYLFTANDLCRLNQYLLNRPGRIYYKIEFEGLMQDAVEEYCNEHLKNPKYLEEIVSISGRISDFSFDMLSSLVEEVNRYDVPPKDACKMLNIDPCISGMYEIQVYDKDGNELYVNRDERYRYLRADDIDDPINVRFSTEPDGEKSYLQMFFSDITRIENKTLVYENLKDGVTVRLTPGIGSSQWAF